MSKKQITEQAPLVSFAETCLKSKDNILVRQLAKIACDEGINIGEKRLYQKMRDWGLIFKGSTEPYQSSVDNGYFVVVEKNVDTPYGVRLVRTTKVCPKGQVYVIERLKKEAKGEYLN
jgi:phage antirepressor YoqD-like protein